MFGASHPSPATQPRPQHFSLRSIMSMGDFHEFAIVDILVDMCREITADESDEWIVGTAHSQYTTTLGVKNKIKPWVLVAWCMHWHGADPSADPSADDNAWSARTAWASGIIAKIEQHITKLPKIKNISVDPFAMLLFHYQLLDVDNGDMDDVEYDVIEKAFGKFVPVANNPFNASFALNKKLESLRTNIINAIREKFMDSLKVASGRYGGLLIRRIKRIDKAHDLFAMDEQLIDIFREMANIEMMGGELRHVRSVEGSVDRARRLRAIDAAHIMLVNAWKRRVGEIRGKRMRM